MKLMQKAYCRAFVLILVLFVLWPLSAAEEDIKSRIASLDRLPLSDRLESLCQLAEDYRDIIPDQASAFAGRAYKLGKRLGAPKHQCRALMVMASERIHAGKSADAMEYLQEAIDKARAIKERWLQVQAMMMKAEILVTQKKQPQALNLILDGKHLMQEEGRDGRYARVLYQLAGVQLANGLYQEALTTLDNTIRLARELQENELEIRAHLAMAEAYIDRQDYDSALSSLKNAEERLTPMTDLALALMTMERLARVYEQKGQIQNSLIYNRRSLDIKQKVQRNDYFRRYTLHDAVGETKQANSYYRRFKDLDSLIEQREKEERERREREQRQADAVRDDIVEQRMEQLQKEINQQKKEKDELIENVKQKDVNIESMQSRITRQEELVRELEILNRIREQALQIKQQELKNTELTLNNANLELEKQRLALVVFLLVTVIMLLIIWMVYMRYRDKKRAHEEMERLAKKDPLTGLSNRREMLDMIQQEMYRYERNRREFAFIMVDIDHFKRINDTWGHDGGDAIIIGISEILRDTVRRNDVVSRWGGEEFLLMLLETDEEGALTVAEKLRQNIAERDFRFKDYKIHVTATLGLTLYKGFKSLEEYLKDADEALYSGKRAGRNRVIVTGKTDSAEAVSEE